MDSDDISVPERCEWQLKAFAQNNVSIISGAVQEFMDDTAQAGTVRYVPESSEKIAVYAKKGILLIIRQLCLKKVMS